MTQIFELIRKVREDIGTIGKNHNNTHFGYRFRSVDDVLNAFGPVLTKHEIISTVTVSNHLPTVLPDPTPETTKPKHKYRATLLVTVTFHAPDGSTLSTTAAGEGLDDNGDKATYKAMSGGYKYALLMGLCIPVVDSKAFDDPDKSKRSQATVKPVTQTCKVIASADAEKLKEIKAAIGRRIIDKMYTEEEVATLNAALSQRTKQLENGRAPAHA